MVNINKGVSKILTDLAIKLYAKVDRNVSDRTRARLWNDYRRRFILMGDLG